MKRSAGLGDDLKGSLEINKFRFRPKIKNSKDLDPLIILDFQSQVNNLNDKIILCSYFFLWLWFRKALKYACEFHELQCDLAYTYTCTHAIRIVASVRISECFWLSDLQVWLFLHFIFSKYSNSNVNQSLIRYIVFLWNKSGVFQLPLVLNIQISNSKL